VSGCKGRDALTDCSLPGVAHGGTGSAAGILADGAKQVSDAGGKWRKAPFGAVRVVQLHGIAEVVIVGIEEVDHLVAVRELAPADAFARPVGELAELPARSPHPAHSTAPVRRLIVVATGITRLHLYVSGGRPQRSAQSLSLPLTG
jgi:hypothetical protein